MMIFYNTEAGKKLKNTLMGILRRHSKPDIDRLERYRTNIPELEMLAYSSAEYCLAEEKDTVHYGLNSDTYTHATSPIRRYADLVNQRVLKLLIRGINDRYIVPQAMYDMNMRAKGMKRFSRDMDFLKAISTGETTFSGIIMEKIQLDNNYIKIKIYIPLWKRMISAKYIAISDNIVLSRDEKQQIDVTDYKEVTIKCSFNMNSRNWKERVIFNIIS
jgi:exoribonuclease R